MMKSDHRASSALCRYGLMLGLSWSVVSCAGLYAEAPPEVAREFRGVWVATVENIDWPSRRDLSAEEQRAELTAILDQAKRLNLNAIILQIRPACDALYKSDLEPWSAYLTGRAGRAPKPPYDPLQFAIEESHARGLELHAWFNPFRARHAVFRGRLPRRHVVHAHPSWVRTYGKYEWLDPGEPDAVEHTLRVIEDVVTRYDLDGVHIDDYFYPYPIQDESKAEVPFPDDESYAKRDESDRELSRDDWRRANVDRFVREMYQRVKKLKPWVKVGVSPFGIWRPGHPPGIQGFDQYAKLYADARRWVREGWLDYATPQLYWAIDSPEQSYPLLLAWWHQQNVRNRHLWPGNYTSRLSAENDPVWNADEIVRQIELTRQQDGATGNIHFSMKAFLRDYAGVNQVLIDSVYSEPALIPASPWLGQEVPAPPGLRLRDSGDERFVTWDVPPNESVAQWVVQLHGSNGWKTHLAGGRLRVWQLPAETDDVAVSAVSRVGLQGPPALMHVGTSN
jgi:uncharacterized lipoprotein YddW (UPF0748 family)